MTKKELIEMLSPLSDDAILKVITESRDLIGTNIYASDINGYFERSGYYILTTLNVQPRLLTKESND